MTKEALKLALEALEDLGMKHYESTGEVLYKETFTAIKEALANEALEKMAENARELGLDYEPEQEPVAWRAWVSKFPQGTGSDWVYVTKPIMKDSIHNQPLYTTPPQRTWVGLTRIELIKCGVLPFGMSYELYEAIEQALKERNT